jgi:antitoxin Xre/MbcA/ParS-like protein
MSPRTRAQVYEDLKELRRRGELPDDPLEVQAWVETITLQIGDHFWAISENSIRFLDVKALADRVFGDEKKADDWLVRPNESLSGQKPVDLLKDELGAAVVRETLERIDSGIFA